MSSEEFCVCALQHLKGIIVQASYKQNFLFAQCTKDGKCLHLKTKILYSKAVQSFYTAIVKYLGGLPG